MNSCITDLTAKDICDIIKQCGESGVAEISISDLHLTFQDRKAEGNETQQSYLAGQPDAIHKPFVDNIQDFIKPDEINLREDQVAEMAITDPLLMEELLASRDIG